MSIIKYASVEKILEVKSSPHRLSYSYEDQPGSGLQRFAALQDGFRKEDGYLYVRCRAISSRVNKNNDGWPSEELANAYQTFSGRPIFVDHNNDDPRRTRGVIVDSKLHVDDGEKVSALDPYYSTAPDNHKPPTWIELLMEVDAETFPKLGQAIESGDMDAVSMGANIERSICSVCANEATTSDEYCSHIKQKGLTFEITADNGEKIRKKAYEDCYGVNFFEISNVFDPADETADSGLAFKGAKVYNSNEVVELAKRGRLDPEELAYYLSLKNQYKESSVKLADLPEEELMAPVNQKEPSDDNRNYVPQSDKVTAPQEVNTLRSETECPICHAGNMETDPDGIQKCPVCGHVGEPEPTNNPDLGQAKEDDALRSEPNDVSPFGDTMDQNPLDSIEFSEAPAMATSKTNIPRRGIIEMSQFKTLIRTTNKGLVDTIVPVKTARVEAKFANGVHRGIYEAAKEAGLNVKVSYPAVKKNDNFVEIPGSNGIFNLFLAQESAATLKVPMREVPIVVEADTQEDVDKFLKLLEETLPPSRRARTAASDKQAVLPPSKTVQDSPKKEKVVEDALAPTEARSVVVTDDTVELEGKTYRLVSIDDEEKDDSKPKETEEKETEEETPKAESEVPEAESSDEKESKLLAAFTLADLSVEMGLTDQENKMAYIAALEEESLEQINAKLAMLNTVKTSGLGKKKASSLNLRKVPRLAHAAPVATNGSMPDVPDEALFM